MLQNKSNFIFQPSEVPTRMYILSSAYICFKMNMSLIQTTRAPKRTNSAPGGVPHSLGNLCLPRNWNPCTRMRRLVRVATDPGAAVASLYLLYLHLWIWLWTHQCFEHAVYVVIHQRFGPCLTQYVSSASLWGRAVWIVESNSFVAQWYPGVFGTVACPSPTRWVILTFFPLVRLFYMTGVFAEHQLERE
jgi:hypothetical protein